MEFRISDTFTSSLTRLTGDEQKAVKTTAFDLQLNPTQPGMQFHRLERAKDPKFWSVRVSRDIRLIVHKTAASLMLCYVDHHDDAYEWAQRRRIERHPTTGAAQLVEVRETVREIPVIQYVAEPAVVEVKPPLFTEFEDDELLAYGVPTDWLSDVRQANEDSVLDLAERLPDEAAEALLALAVGDRPPSPTRIADGEDAFDHPDAQRRFRAVDGVEELERAFDFPWERWSVFLHPDQRALVEQVFDGPARVAGTAGTGKTVVALHRAVHLARSDPDARVLLTTFSEPLASALRAKVRRLVAHEPMLAERLEVHALDSVAQRLTELRIGSVKLASDEDVRRRIDERAADVVERRLTSAFLWKEWRDVVDAWQLSTWDAYRDVPRLGRRVRLSEAQRETAWGVFEAVCSELAADGLRTRAGLFRTLENSLAESETRPFRYIVVDEAQDIGVAELRLLSAMAGARDTLFFAGDLGQRIFRPPFSWKALGVDIVGRSHCLRVNYRTSHQIRRRVDRLLPNEMSDVDGVSENRRGVVSVFNGPDPVIEVFDSAEDEIEGVARWLSTCVEAGVAPEQVAVFVRSAEELGRAKRAAEATELPWCILDQSLTTKGDHIALATMHQAKGLEFQAVAVMACDDEVVPSQERIESVAEQAELDEVYRTERHLLYVACTRARDDLLVTGVEPASEFLEDMQ